jgi:hypothetical protein
MKLTLRKRTFSFAILMYMGLFLYFFLRTYSPGRSENFAGASAVLFLALIASIGVLFLYSLSAFRKKHLLFLFFLICVFEIAMFSSTFGYYTGESQGVINNFTQQILFFVFMVLVVSYRPWRKIKFTYVLAHFLLTFAVFTAIVGWQAILTGQGLFGPLSFGLDVFDRTRLMGFHASSTYAGLPIALGLISAVYLWCMKTGGKLWAYYFLIMFIGLSVVATGSRGSMLVAVSGVFVFIVMHKGRMLNLLLLIKTRWFYILMCTILVFFGVYFILPEDNLVRHSTDTAVHRAMTKTAKMGGIEEEARTVFLLKGIEFYANGSLFDNLFGFGNGAYTSIFQHSTHNAYLHVLFHWGFLSLVVLFVIFAWLFNLAFRYKTNSRQHLDRAFLVSLLTATAVRGMFQTGELLNFGYNWGVVIAISAIIVRKQSNFFDERSGLELHFGKRYGSQSEY